VKIDSLLGSEQEHAKSKHRCALSTAFCRALDEITDRKIGERAAVFFTDLRESVACLDDRRQRHSCIISGL
jgi:hypothetical protein